MPAWSRRRVLHVAGVGTATALAGCSQSDDDATTTTRTESTTTSTTQTTTQSTTEATTTDRPPLDVSMQWSQTAVAEPVSHLWLPRHPPRVEQTGGPLVAATEAGAVLGIDLDTGEVLWRHTVPGRPTGLLAARDTGYVVSETFESDPPQGYLTAIRVTDGTERWQWRRREFLQPLAVVDGRVAVAGHYIVASEEELGPQRSPRGEGRVHVLDDETGDPAWTEPVPKLETAAAAEHGVYALARTEDGAGDRLRRFDLDGTASWTADTGSSRGGPLATTDDGVVAAVDAGDLSSMDGDAGLYAPDDGSVEWTVSPDGDGPYAARVATQGPYDDTVFFVGDGIVATGLDGEVRWRRYGDLRPLDATWHDPLVLAGDQSVLAVSPATGEVAWRYEPSVNRLDVLAALDDAAVVHHDVWTDTEFGYVTGPEGTMRELVVTPTRYEAVATHLDAVLVGTTDGVYAYQSG